MTPPSFQWIQSFADLVGCATLDGVRTWDVRDDADPLKKVVHFRFARPLRSEIVAPLRNLLAGWADCNDCVYRRSEWKGHEFTALILLKGLTPPSNKSPFDKEENAWKSGRGSGGRLPSEFRDAHRGRG